MRVATGIRRVGGTTTGLAMNYIATLLFLAHRTAAELALGHEDVFERFLQTLFTVFIGVWMLRHDGTFDPIYACLTSRHGQLCQICGDQCENGMACMLPYAAANLAHLGRA